MQFNQIVLGGWTAIVILFLYLPVILLAVFSFNRSPLNESWQGFTFDWYRQLWNDQPLVESLENSLIIAAATTVLSVILGTGGAWICHRYRFRFASLINAMIFVPMLIPEIIMGISLLLLFTIVNTWGNSFLMRLGWTDEPLRLGFVTVIISHVTFCFPFVLVVIQSRLAGIDPALEEAAMDLGATPTRAFRSVIVPYLLPAIAAGALMSFTLSLDELIVTYFTTGPQSTTLPIKVFGMAKVGLNPSLNAISTIFVAVTAVLVLAAEWLRRIYR